MRSIFHFIATHLGARPVLNLSFLAIWAGMLGYGTIRYVQHTDGLLLFNIGPEAAAWMLRFFIAMTVAIFSWRTMTVNRIIQNMAEEAFVQLKGRTPQETEREKLQFLLQPILAKKKFPARFLEVVRLMPEPNVGLSLVLMLATIILTLFYEILRNAPDNSVSDLVFANTPWVMILLLFGYLLYHDVWSLECIRKKVLYLSNLAPETSEMYIAKFMQSLTRAETTCFQKKYHDQLRNKEIAAALFVSESAVKTHINNMNKKWDHFATEHGIMLSLKDFMAQKV